MIAAPHFSYVLNAPTPLDLGRPGDRVAVTALFAATVAMRCKHDIKKKCSPY